MFPLVAWLPPGQLQADALLDLKTDENRLSVFEVNDLPNVERIATAIAAGRQNPDVLDYVVFDGAPLPALGINVQQVPGTTADPSVNTLHHNLHQLTAGQLVAVADVIRQGTQRRILPKRVRQLVNDGLAAGRLDRTKVNPKLLGQL